VLRHGNLAALFCTHVNRQQLAAARVPSCVHASWYGKPPKASRIRSSCFIWTLDSPTSWLTSPLLDTLALSQSNKPPSPSCHIDPSSFNKPMQVQPICKGTTLSTGLNPTKAQCVDRLADDPHDIAHYRWQPPVVCNIRTEPYAPASRECTAHRPPPTQRRGPTTLSVNRHLACSHHLCKPSPCPYHARVLK
jgi:hypothetical protein